MIDNEALVSKLEEISCRLYEIEKEQINIKKMIEKNNKILMQRINKLEEYNEINDMRDQYFNEELKYISKKINERYY